MELIPIVIALLGGGTIATLIGIILHYRSENARTYAEGGKLEAEADVTITDSVQRRYDSLFDDLEHELVRMREAEAVCRSALDETRHRLDGALTQIGQLRLEAANATADVKLARAEIVRLQDTVDLLEAKITKRRSSP